MTQGGFSRIRGCNARLLLANKRDNHECALGDCVLHYECSVTAYPYISEKKIANG
jgi:hypothetical protein